MVQVGDRYWLQWEAGMALIQGLAGLFWLRWVARLGTFIFISLWPHLWFSQKKSRFWRNLV